MYSMEIIPRFCETDALGHINNTVFSIWCEAARTPIFQIFNPDQEVTHWNLIVARLEIDMKKPCYFPHPVTIHTEVIRVGRSSFDVMHTLIQQEEEVASVKAVLVHYDYKKQTSVEISSFFRSQLE